MSGHELIVEDFEIIEDGAHSVTRVDQVCDSKVVSAVDLAETTAWHCHYSCFIYHVEAVLKVGLHSSLQAIVNKLLRKVEFGEAVHCSFDLGASHLVHLIKSVRQHICSFLKTTEYLVPFCLVLSYTFRGFSSEFGRVD